MTAISIKTSHSVIPMIYAYTTPGIPYHDGYIKIGYTEQDVDTRIKQQTHTAGIKAKKEWQGMAIYDDGSGETFKDFDFHAFLRRNGVKQPADIDNSGFKGKDKNEWFYITPQKSRDMFYAFKANHGADIEESDKESIAYILRDEQAQAVSEAAAYYKDHPGKEFLWNAKPRFGKTLSVYDFCRRIGAEKVLIVTNRPSIANSWYSDFIHFGFNKYYFFVTNSSALKKKKYTYESDSPVVKNQPCVEFESLQDLKGSLYFGGKFDKYKKIADTEWDLLVIDEAHEGVDTDKTDTAFDRINRKFTLHLSGTPFKALASAKFPDDAIFNWTYADEQAKKRMLAKTDSENPYSTLPQLNMYTYQMSEIVKDLIKQGIDIDGEVEEYAFDLNEFFKVNENGHFIHEKAVDRFLDALTTQEKFPFSTEELRHELKHTFWLLDRVDSAKELAKKLNKHPIFKDYEVVLAAGDGKLDPDEENKKSFDKVVDAIRKNDKTITLSVEQLTTGVTIPEWTAVLILSNVASPSKYMQAAFRAQNPCLFHEGTSTYRKENAYVFDFDPARTLVIFEEFANDLISKTARGGGSVEERKKNIKELLNFFPVLGEDENGEMIRLDAEKVLSIPRKIKSQEVVQRGFMSNFLFQNISNIFNAPKELMDVLNGITKYKEGKNTREVKKENVDVVNVNENGDPVVSDELVIGITSDIFGDKIYDTEIIQDIVVEQTQDNQDVAKTAIENAKNKIKKDLHDKFVAPTINKAKENYGDDMKKSDTNQMERIITSDINTVVDKSYGDFIIETNTLEVEKQKELSQSTSNAEDKAIIKKFEDLKAEATQKLQETLKDSLGNIIENAPKQIVEHVEKKKVERKRDSVMEDVRDRLRGFTRTIPSFLMAYGDNSVTLATFDKKVPGEVFFEVTSITLEQFRFLRDGGEYTDPETQEEKHFDGQLFDPVVFDDSVKEFLRLKQKLANYFDEKAIEDIFDYIPPQKTNQIFTPKDVVKKMVDMLEQENPGCFDEPDKTFVDLYMKSGLYITEIVKRLYRSEMLKKLYPDEEERLQHIFEKQVYGLAPTEIIYRIATNYILGFDKDVKIEKHNFKLADAVPYAKEGSLQELLDKLYPGE